MFQQTQAFRYRDPRASESGSTGADSDLSPPGGSPPCFKPPTPVEDTSFPRRAQEISFKAEIPTATLCPKEIYWLVEWKNGTTWQVLYEHLSPNSRTHEFTENNKLMTPYGAAGLVVGKEHRVSVAYTCGALTPPEYPNSTCYSDPAYDGTTEDGSPRGFIPTAFRGGVSLPTIPSEFLSGATSFQEMEDSFTRPSTTPKRVPGSLATVTGNGLGPDSVWLDSNPYSVVGNGSKVVAGSGVNYAYLPQAATAQYAAEFANSHSFVEALFGRDSLNGGDVINFELHGRQFMDGSTLRSYWVKFLKNRLGAPSDQAHILIGSPTCLGEIGDPPVPEPLPTGWACNALGSVKWLEIKRLAIPKTDPGLPSTDPNYKCYGFPTLTPGTNQRMWLQMQVNDDFAEENNPHIFVVAAWDPNSPTSDCGTSGDITSCPRVCRLDVVDPTMTLGDRMEAQKGHVMCSAHDANYRLWVTRFGSRQ